MRSHWLTALWSCSFLLCATIFGSGAARASSDDPCSGIPNCQMQPQPTITFDPEEGKGMAYYCTGNYMYYWGIYYAGDYNRWTQTSDCFTTSEDDAPEVGHPNKLDVDIHNWCDHHEPYNISIACSANPPPNYAPTCGSHTESQPIFHDPKCPIQGNISNVCNGLQTQLCFQTWTEQCTSPSELQYFCNEDIYLGLTTCTPCSN
jgi:hypothetical protein